MAADKPKETSEQRQAMTPEAPAESHTDSEHHEHHENHEHHGHHGHHGHHVEASRPEDTGHEASGCKEEPETEEQILTKNTGEPQEERRPG